jgi:hypothetical protein
VVSARQVRIEGLAGDPVQGDGDIITALPLTATLADRPLEILVPAGSAAHLPATVMPSIRSVGELVP